MAILNFRIFLTALVMGAAGGASADPVSVPTYRGIAEVANTPSKIIALDIAAVDTLHALNAPLIGVPSKLYVNYLDSVGSAADPVGTLFEPDFEAMARMQADLIVAGGRSSKQFDALTDIAPTLDMTIWGEDHVATALQRLHSYGKILSKPEAAVSLEQAFLAKLAKAKSAISGKGSALIVLTNGPKVSVYGKGSRFGWLHAALDLPETVEGVDAQTHGEAVSFEFISNANPDWLIVVDRAAAIGLENQSAKVTLDNALVAQTTAWQKDQIIYLNAANIYIAGGGIQSMSHTLDEIIAGFASGA
ncbi:iron complex transport system substrate-binding protein [Epibacterium ulvae]|uniref:Iron complex transport system substrate-binding protein n=1 Tax=Epibacterium ulvae TaxID=1156985 RepID=A0A1G5QSH7_9RHOB|nr:siderophore ABC transporter substrate-binding protein [Epibacterium ulvae]SCZ64717.1 iron complex transport system substrate-binding protein [Epibacterium ulvae]